MNKHKMQPLVHAMIVEGVAKGEDMKEYAILDRIVFGFGTCEAYRSFMKAVERRLPFDNFERQ